MRFRTRREMPVLGIIMSATPSTGGFEATLPAGEILIVRDEPPDFAKGITLVPARYSEWERLVVPENERAHAAYTGYAVVCSFDRVDSDLELV
jgi:hypothetical protein